MRGGRPSCNPRTRPPPRADAMPHRRAATTSLLVCLGFAGMTLSGDAPDTPIGPKWWPAEWGRDAQRGAATRLPPQRVRDAARLIREGKIYSLGRPYEHGMPLPGKRHFSLTIPGSPTGGPDGKNRLVYFDDLFS